MVRKKNDSVGGALGVAAVAVLAALAAVPKAAWLAVGGVVVVGVVELMLDGALERINEASLDAHEMALTEGEDPLEVNEEVLEKLEA